MDIKVHIKAGMWSGFFTGLLVSFIESTFLLFSTGSFVVNFLFFLKASLIYGLLGIGGGFLLASFSKILLLRKTYWGEDKLKSFYFSILLSLSLFVGVAVYLLDIVFPLLMRDFSVFLYIALAGILSTILAIGLFKFFPLSKLGGERRWFVPVSFMILAVTYVGLFIIKQTNELQNYIPRKAFASAQKPNVIIISIDTTRADRLSAYGHYRPTTPYIDRLAKEGRLFKNAIAPSIWTVPSHASLFTGLYPSKHGLGYLSDYLPQDIPTLAEILSKQGYRSFSIYNNPFAGRLVGYHKGFDEALGVNIDRRVSLTLERLIHRLVYKDVGANSRKTIDIASNWIAQTASTGLPYFAFVHFNDVHSEYLAREPYFSQFIKDIDLGQVDLFRVHQVNAHKRSYHKYLRGEVQPSPTDFEYLKTLYDSEIRAVDELIGRLMDSLKEKGFLKNTLVVITSDHGEYMGEHQLMNHRFYLYDPVLRIPLIFWYPEQVQPGVEIRYASLVDVLPTVLSLANLKDQIPAHIQGVNLIPEGTKTAGLEIISSTEALKDPLSEEFHQVNLSASTESRVVFSEWWGLFLRGSHQGRAKEVILREDLKRNEILDLTTRPDKDSSKAVFSGDWKFIWLSNGEHELYHLTSDPGEQKNLREVYPEKAQELQAKLEQWLNSFEHARATFNPNKREFKQTLKSLGYVQ